MRSLHPGLISGQLDLANVQLERNEVFIVQHRKKTPTICYISDGIPLTCFFGSSFYTSHCCTGLGRIQDAKTLNSNLLSSTVNLPDEQQSASVTTSKHYGSQSFFITMTRNRKLLDRVAEVWTALNRRTSLPAYIGIATVSLQVTSLSTFALVHR